MYDCRCRYCCRIKHPQPVPDQDSIHMLTSDCRWTCLLHRHWYCHPCVRFQTWTVHRYVPNLLMMTNSHCRHHCSCSRSIHPDCHYCREQMRFRPLRLLPGKAEGRISLHCKTADYLSSYQTGLKNQYYPSQTQYRPPDNPVKPDRSYRPHTVQNPHRAVSPEQQQITVPPSAPVSSCQ